MVVYLIKELLSGNIYVHQIHKTKDNALATIRETYSGRRDLSIEVKDNGTVGGLKEEFVTVSFEIGGVKTKLFFSITAMPVFDCVDHL